MRPAMHLPSTPVGGDEPKLSLRLILDFVIATSVEFLALPTTKA